MKQKMLTSQAEALLLQAEIEERAWVTDAMRQCKEDDDKDRVATMHRLGAYTLKVTLEQRNLARDVKRHATLQLAIEKGTDLCARLPGDCVERPALERVV